METTQTVYNREIKEEFRDELEYIEKGERNHWLNQKDGKLAYILNIDEHPGQKSWVSEILKIDENFKAYYDED